MKWTMWHELAWRTGVVVVGTVLAGLWMLVLFLLWALTLR